LQRRHARLLADFERERRIVKSLRHPNLCRLFGVSTCPGMSVFVCAWIEPVCCHQPAPCIGWIDRMILPFLTDTCPILTNTNTGSLCLVYDFLEGGSLAGLLRDRSKGYDLFQARLF
jgi:serine/threonine protein kinase